MASNAPTTIPSPQQPGLRPYIIYDRLGAGCLAHIVTETTCLILHHGETVVVDTSDRAICTGELFLMESGRSSPAGPTRSIVEFKQRSYCIRDDDGEYRDAPCWTALFYSELVALDGSSREAIRFSDGPVKLRDAQYFEERIIGRVIGILEAKFVEPLRLIAA